MDTVADKLPPASWSEALDRSLADIGAGKTVPLEPVLARARASIARVEARQQGLDEQTSRKA